MKIGLLLLFVITFSFPVLAQDSNKAKGGTIQFNTRPRIKTKAQAQKDLEKKEMEIFLKEIETKIFADEDVDVSPNFIEGGEAYYRFIQRNLNVQVPVSEGAVPGKYQVVVSFVIMKDGTVMNVEAKTDYGYGMEKEAERVIKKSSKLWASAKLRGKDVMCEEELTLTFQINE
jgi:hypothetical protein